MSRRSAAVWHVLAWIGLVALAAITVGAGGVSAVR